jgi:hypothetical protein
MRQVKRRNREGRSVYFHGTHPDEARDAARKLGFSYQNRNDLVGLSVRQATKRLRQQGRDVGVYAGIGTHAIGYRDRKFRGLNNPLQNFKTIRHAFQVN